MDTRMNVVAMNAAPQLEIAVVANSFILWQLFDEKAASDEDDTRATNPRDNNLAARINNEERNLHDGIWRNGKMNWGYKEWKSCALTTIQQQSKCEASKALFVWHEIGSDGGVEQKKKNQTLILGRSKKPTSPRRCFSIRVCQHSIGLCSVNSDQIQEVQDSRCFHKVDFIFPKNDWNGSEKSIPVGLNLGPKLQRVGSFWIYGLCVLFYCP